MDAHAGVGQNNLRLADSLDKHAAEYATVLRRHYYVLPWLHLLFLPKTRTSKFTGEHHPWLLTTPHPPVAIITMRAATTISTAVFAVPRIIQHRTARQPPHMLPLASVMRNRSK